MKRIHINTHDATHVNVPIHATQNGKTLDDYSVEDFVGDAVIFETPQDIEPGIGLIFRHQNIDMELAKMIAEKKPKFIGLASTFEFDESVEKYLLAEGIISFERLANTEKLANKFKFYGVPLPIKASDGSPVRAFAIY